MKLFFPVVFFTLTSKSGRRPQGLLNYKHILNQLKLFKLPNQHFSFSNNILAAFDTSKLVGSN